MPLDISIEAQKLRELYQESGVKKFNALVAGESGCGKTSLARSAVGPVHIDSFCPGGTRSIRDLVSEGHVLADIRWEVEDPYSPAAFMGWEKSMEERIQEGYFEHIGTYILDEITSFADAIMNQILKNVGLLPMRGNKPVSALDKTPVPRTGKGNQNDYVTQRIALELWIKRILQLPCNVIITAHLTAEEKEGEARKYVLAAPGQARTKLPQLFDEFYTMVPKRTSSGVNRMFMTIPDHQYPARSRLSMNGLLEPLEKADLKAIMTKVGLDTADKPSI